jgi:hypothetical protein
MDSLRHMHSPSQDTLAHAAPEQHCRSDGAGRSGSQNEVADLTVLSLAACRKMFALLAMTMLDDVNTINTWAEPHNANGVTPNTVIDSNDEPPQNNQQRMSARGY